MLQSRTGSGKKNGSKVPCVIPNRKLELFSADSGAHMHRHRGARAAGVGADGLMSAKLNSCLDGNLIYKVARALGE